MPSSPDQKKLKEAGMDAAFNPPAPHPAKAIMDAIAHMMGNGAPEPEAAPAAQQCPNCGHTIGDQINYPQGPSK